MLRRRSDEFAALMTEEGARPSPMAVPRSRNAPFSANLLPSMEIAPELVDIGGPEALIAFLALAVMPWNFPFWRSFASRHQRWEPLSKHALGMPGCALIRVTLNCQRGEGAV